MSAPRTGAPCARPAPAARAPAAPVMKARLSHGALLGHAWQAVATAKASAFAVLACWGRVIVHIYG